MQLENVFQEPLSSHAEGELWAFSSEKVYFAGSLWCIDLKRYQSKTEQAEFVAVYLRRRSVSCCLSRMGAVPMTHRVATLAMEVQTRWAGGAVPPHAFEDKRDRTTLAFSIRLCGAPGAPTSNSVCGRSVMGKAFGCESETSWGWENYISTQSLTERPWASGDKLRFAICLDML